MSPSCVIYAHGGEWNDNTYVGGRKEYIPIPPMGITFEDFLGKVELRLKKDRSMYVIDVDALVQSPVGETMRMNISDEFEWTSMFGMLELPTVYVSCSRRLNDYSTKRKRHCDRNRGNVCLSNRSCNVDDYDDYHDDELIGFGSENLYEGCSDNVVDCNADCFDDHDNYCGTDIHSVPLLDVSIQSSKGTDDDNDTEKNRWSIPGSSHQSSLPCDDLVLPTEIVTNELKLGGIFKDKETMITAVGYYHMKNHVASRTDRSSSSRYHLICKLGKESCKFDMLAIPMGKAWRISNWVTHTCELDLRHHPKPKVSSKVLAAEFIDNFSEDGFILRPRDMQGKMLREYGVNVQYRTALAGKHMALDKSYDDADESFQLLPMFLHLLQNSNPGSIVGLRTLDDGRFQFVFFALAASIRAFRACRPIIVLDGTHLKGKYRGIMFIAAARDANNQIVPLAFGIGDKENDESWTCFLEQVRIAFGCPPNCLIVSDQHLSIKNAVESIYPGVPHGLCTFHIQSNMKKSGYGAFVIEIFQAAACAYVVEDFDEHMRNMKDSAPRAHARLMNIDPIKWAICKCPVRRFDYGTSNAVEVINNRIKWARGLPVCALLEHVRNMCQLWFFDRRTKAVRRTQELSEYATKRLENAIEAGRFMKVEPISDLKMKVISGSRSYVVDLVSRNCSCHVFDFDLIPCSHATAAISHVRQAPVSYVHDYYKTSTLREIYAGEVMPIPDRDKWSAPPPEVAARVVRTPNNPRQAGRPRSKRIPSGYGRKNDRVCSRCNGKGHYQNTCTVVLQSIPVEESSSNDPCSKKVRKPKKCGICGVVGHTRLTCDDPHRFE